mmetsp:Transcript_47297/g.147863  ORF Transcript_47297/g.147863 Transcript_47297/m.147863 type:complete len:85 (+) Transcript_47297:160-414(+)
MQAGDHAGSTYYELHRFVDAALSPGAKPDVTLEDGALAVMMGVGARFSRDVAEIWPRYSRTPLYSAGTRLSSHVLASTVLTTVL